MSRSKKRKHKHHTKEELEEALLEKGLGRTNRVNPLVTSKMMKYVALLVDYSDARGLCAKMKDVPVSKTCVYVHWLRNPVFLEFYKEERERMMKLHAIGVDRAMIKKAKKGNSAMTKLYYQRSGEMGIEGTGSMIDKATEVIVNTNIPRPKED